MRAERCSAISRLPLCPIRGKVPVPEFQISGNNRSFGRQSRTGQGACVKSDGSVRHKYMTKDCAKATQYPSDESRPKLLRISYGQKMITSDALFADLLLSPPSLRDTSPYHKGRHEGERATTYHKGRQSVGRFGTPYHKGRYGEGRRTTPPFVRKGRREERGAALPCHRQGQKEQPGTSYRERVKRRGEKGKNASLTEDGAADTRFPERSDKAKGRVETSGASERACVRYFHNGKEEYGKKTTVRDKKRENKKIPEKIEKHGAKQLDRNSES